MSVKDCLARIQAAAGKRKLSEDEIADLTERVEARKARLMRADPSLAPADAYARAGDEIGTEIAAVAAIERRNRAMNLEKRIGRRSFYADAPGQGKTPGIVIGLKAKLGGVNTPFARGRLSVDAQAVALKADYGIGLITDLEDAGLLGIVRRGEMDDEWAAELAELSKGAAGNPGITGNARALEIARIADKYKRLARADANRAGAWIGEYEGHIDRTSHDPDRIRKAGYQAWKENALRNLDADRAFEGVADPEAFLQSVYDGLVTGIHFTAEGMQGFKDPAFKGPKNLAGKLSEARVLHWRDAAAWMDYQRAFGNGTLIEGVLSSLEHSARSTALMREFGTNPRAEFEADLAWLREQHRSNADVMQKLRNAERGLVNVMNELDGTALAPQNRMAARIGAGVRSWISMSKLGGVVLSAIGDVPMKAAELRYNDVNLLQAYGDGIASIMRGRPKGEQREIARLLRAGFEGMRGDITSRFDVADALPGTLSKVQNVFFKITGISWWTDAQRAGMTMVLARHLGLHSAADHADLPTGTARVLGLYGIGPAEWNALRTVDWHQADGRRYLTPDIAGKLSDEAVDALAGRALKPDARAGLRRDLELKLLSYFSERGRFGVIEPGANERAILRLGTEPGTALGEAMRYMTQFKAFPVAVISRAWGREFYGGQGRPGAIAGIAHMMVAGTVFGYLAMAAKDIVKGRTPRDPTDPKTWAAAFVQGGGAGIYGDFIVGEYNRFGRSMAATAAGPTLGQLDDVAELWNRVKAGDDPSAQAFRFMVGNAPFANLFYLRPALDYLLLYQVQEALSPGFLRRFERRIERENKQDFILSPSSAIPHGGGNRIFEGLRP